MSESGGVEPGGFDQGSVDQGSLKRGSVEPGGAGAGIVGIGVDVCSLDRWRAMAGRRPGVIQRVLTADEADLPLESQAARFAAKEALAKALGAPGDLAWHDAEVCLTPQGQPYFVLRGTVAQRADGLGVGRVHLSLSHDAGIATAFVVAERR